MNDSYLQGLAMALAPYLLPYLTNKVKDEFSIDQVKESESEVLLSRNEVCQKLGVSSATLWRWDKANYLKPVRIGSKTMYRKEDLKKLSK